MDSADGNGKQRPAKDVRRQLGEAQKRHQARLNEAKRNTSEARRTHERAIDGARSELKTTERAHEKELADAHNELQDAQTGRLIGSLGGVRLFDNRLEAPDGVVELSQNIKANVEATGVRTDKTDSRETVLLLDTPKFDSVVRVNPNETTKARELAARINTAAKTADELLEEHRARVERAEQRLATANANQAVVDSATRRLDEVQSDTADVDVALKAEAVAESDTAEIDAIKQELLSLDPTAKIKERPNRASAWWSRRSWKAKAGLVAGTLLVLAITAGALAGGGGRAHSKGRAHKTSKARPLAELVLSRPSTDYLVVRTSRFVIRGSSTLGAMVRMNGSRVVSRGPKFVRPVLLQIGPNRFHFVAQKAGRKAISHDLTIVRKLPLVGLSVSQPIDLITVRSPTTSVIGITTPGATVLVNGSPAGVSGAAFQASISLQRGSNTIRITAAKPGFASRSLELTVVRRLSAAEIEQIAAQRRQAFIDSTVSIPYNQLIKSPDRYAGTKVKYYGEILQVQEDPLGGGILLLYVTDLGYDVWSDQIWVNYTGTIRGAQGDKLTVYGTVVGSKSYTTQAGGDTFVPEIDAKYVVE